MRFLRVFVPLSRIECANYLNTTNENTFRENDPSRGGKHQERSSRIENPRSTLPSSDLALTTNKNWRRRPFPKDTQVMEGSRAFNAKQSSSPMKIALRANINHSTSGDLLFPHFPNFFESCRLFFFPTFRRFVISDH